MKDECRHFGNVIAAQLRSYSETVRWVIQREIMNLFLNANRGFYERYYHTHLQPINPPQAHFPSGPSKMYPQSLPSLSSQNPSPSCSGNTSPSPASQNNNSILSHRFPTENISPSTTCSEENIDTQVFVE